MADAWYSLYPINTIRSIASASASLILYSE
jgi:hypothetical protein